ncbi:PREDICTED: uncharacterized protein LOC104817234 [Tarenaya hassleriana]|uniref:uncharacterized protein LOC104817234 n=1 Tax=Tarenaya hassleriana TaxID=28532 RepID=UPI00053C8C49|nr:PREDICTED: uncharacterized protein LOC104817234 [Tarenaya hassleriana]
MTTPTIPLFSAEDSSPPVSSTSPASAPAVSSFDCFDNPYFLSSGDHAGIQLVTKRLTGAGDYSSWFRAVSMALEGRNKLCFIDGSLPRPADDDPTLRFWNRNNAIVGSWLINSVDEDISQNLMFYPTAREMWLDLAHRFQQSNAPRKYRVRQRLRSLRQGTLDIAKYYTALSTIWEELKTVRINHRCTCGKCTCQVDKRWIDEFESDFVIDFLYGLNNEYESVRNQITMMDPMPDIQRVYNLVIQQEQQRLVKSSIPSEAVVFQSSVSPPDAKVAAVSGNSFKPRQHPLCTHCGLYGHTVQKCYKLHGYPPGYKPSSQAKSSSASKSFSRIVSPMPGPYANLVTENSIKPSPVVPELGSFSIAQLQELCSKISSQLKTYGPSITESGALDVSASSGAYSGLDDWEG